MGVRAGACCLLTLACFAANADEAAPSAGRDHWAFQPIVRPTVPAVSAADRVETPIDAFILRRLEAEGASLSPEADRRTLIRRLKLDLLGLPPTRDETAAFLADGAPDAYGRLVEHFLSDPRYGERAGRLWLDLVRFAETAGYKADETRPLAYRYRDYVIRSFNGNLPYDRFMAEQLAGDELFPDREDALVATGYLRLWPDESNASDVHKARQDALNDITGNVGAAFLGMTIACAQCHDHKFDPIPQADFYRLQAYFAALLPADRMTLGTPAALAEYRAALAAWERKSEPVRSELDAIEAAAKRKLTADKRNKFPDDVLEAIDTPPAARTTKQRQLAFWAERQVDDKFDAAKTDKALSAADRDRRKTLAAELAELEKSKPRPPRTADVLAVADSPAGPADSYLLLGGSYDSEFEEVTPGGLDAVAAIAPALEAVPVSRPGSTGRRAALAAWLADPQNPLPARVMVNRLWQSHFGRGLVATANDFGVQTPPPSHPELLDWLAAEFVESGWDVKRLHRLIVTSGTYRQRGAIAECGVRSADSLEPNPKSEIADPQSRYAVFPRRRLEAEAIRDSLLFVAGRLGDGMYGPGVRPELPAGFTTGEPWAVSKNESDRDRRSVYVFAKRNLPHPFLAAFDLPDMHEACGCRVTTTTAPQALTLLNGAEVLGYAKSLAARLSAADDSLDPTGLIAAAFETTLGRPPSTDEAEAAAAFLREQRVRIGGKNADREATADLCHALLNANEFLYIE